MRLRTAQNLRRLALLAVVLTAVLMPTNVHSAPAPPEASPETALASRAILALSTEHTTWPTGQLVRQLARRQIDEGPQPAGGLLRFRQRNLWRDYRVEVVAVAAIGTLQSVLIVWLVLEQRRRRRAQVESRHLLEESRAHLLTIAHLDRRAAIGEVTAAITHELNQPLEAILHNAEAAEILLESETPPLDQVREIVGDIRRIDMRAGQIVQRMRGLLRKRELEDRPLDVNELTRDTLALASPVGAGKGVRMDADLAGDVCQIAGDRVHLQQVLLNLVLNGIEAMREMPRERRQLQVKTANCDGHVDIEVRDHGHGIPNESMTQIFEPFFTTKGEGMGIGLSIARKIVEAHGGRIGARNNPDGGATVWFRLPHAAASMARRRPDARETPRLAS